MGGIAAGMVLVAAVPASAATTRYVSPNGTKTGPCTSASNACTLFHASEVSGAGDEVVLAGGTYNNQYGVFSKGEYVHGAPGSFRPILKGSIGFQLLSVQNGGRVEYLRIEQSGSGPALHVKGALVRNVIASSSGPGPAVKLEGTAAGGARELVASTTGASTSAIEIKGGVNHLKNVTAHAAHTTSVAIFAYGTDSVYVGAQNVIARAPDPPAISIQGPSPQDKADLAIAFSNYNGINQTNADINESNNQSAAPAFVNAPAGDFHQTADSVTRNAGQLPGDPGPADIDGDQRVVGTIDIGADEWTGPPYPTTGPATLIGSTVATVNGTVNPSGGATTYYFNWGLTSAYGNPSGFQLFFAPRAAGNGFSPLPVSLKLTGLKPATTYHYRLRATNQSGTVYGADAAFTTAAPGTPDPGGSEPVPGQPGGAILSLTRVGASYKKLRVSKRRTAIFTARRRKPPPRGTTLRYTLSEPATMTIRFETKLPGRRSGRRCVAPRRRLLRAKKCTRVVTVGTLTRRSKLGRNFVPFSGRIGRTALKAGAYTAVFSARDAAGNRSPTRRLGITIVAG